MSRFSLSNLQLRSNLLSATYQQELCRITIFEVKDIRRRCPMLTDLSRLTPKQRLEWTKHLHWGIESVSMSDDDRQRVWLEMLVDYIPDAIVELESRPDVELAFELLVVIEQLCSPEVDSYFHAKAMHWNKRVRAVLARDEFRMQSDFVDQRLAELLGHSLLRSKSQWSSLVTAR